MGPPTHASLPPGPLKKQRFPFQLSPSRRQQNVINLRVIKIFSDKLLGLTNPRRTKLLHGTLLHIGHLSDKTLKKKKRTDSNNNNNNNDNYDDADNDNDDKLANADNAYNAYNA